MRRTQRNTSGWDNPPYIRQVELGIPSWGEVFFACGLLSIVLLLVI